MGERYAGEELTKARDALSDAEELVSVDGSDEGVVNRLYYACFHAAQAALYARGVEPKSHGAVRNQFGSEVVLDGDATREQGRLLTTLADLRQQADYGYEPIEADVDSLLERARMFVADMTALVGPRGHGRRLTGSESRSVGRPWQAEGTSNSNRTRAKRASGEFSPTFLRRWVASEASHPRSKKWRWSTKVVDNPYG